MNILSVIPNLHNDEPKTVAIVAEKNGQLIAYTYSHTYQLLRDPNNLFEWAQWNGGTLTEAIQYIIAL